MDSNITDIKYSEVSNTVDSIDNIASSMEAIFSEFGSSMNVTLSPENYTGQTAEAIRANYEILRPQFTDFIQLVRNFAEEYRKASSSEQTHDTSEAAKAEEINTNLTN